LKANYTCFSKTYHQNNVYQNSKDAYKIVIVSYSQKTAKKIKFYYVGSDQNQNTGQKINNELILSRE